MARPLRVQFEGAVYHVTARGNNRQALYHDDRDRQRFQETLGEAADRYGVAVHGYCLMPNHFHLLLWPREAGELSRFMRWLTLTHTQRWHAHYGSAGEGHLYQGRFKSFPVQEDRHFLIAARYVERNALRARLVERAEDWRWSSLWRRRNGPPPSPAGAPAAVESAGAGEGSAPPPLVLSEWPVRRPRDWLSWVNRPQTAAEEAALRLSVARGRPFGEAAWQVRTAKRLGLEISLRPRGRPRKHANSANKGS